MEKFTKGAKVLLTAYNGIGWSDDLKRRPKLGAEGVVVAVQPLDRDPAQREALVKFVGTGSLRHCNIDMVEVL